jgi:hypothetical protein
MVGSIMIVPTVGFSTAAVQTTIDAGIQVRLHQSQTAAALAIAKEGDGADGQQIVNAWMPMNLGALDRPEDVVVHTYEVTEAGARINSAYQSKPLAAELMNGVFEKASFYDRGVLAERVYRPLEVVVVVDGSSSTRTYVEQYKTSMKNIARAFMRGRETADDVKVSLIAFSGHMNIGTEYADKLIIPSTRALYDDGTVAYEQRRATLTEYNGALISDLLAEGGPGSSFGMACVGRKKLVASSPPAEVAAYVEGIEIPPSTPADGFPLLIGDERPIVENATHTSYGQPNTLITSFLVSNPTKVQSPHSILDYVLIPHEAITGDVHDINSIKTWTYGDNLKWTAASRIAKSSVGIYYNCSNMPMLIGSSDLDELEERVDLYSAGWTTGGDEGLAWALRALSPSWSEIWDKGDDFPAPYHSDVQKVIFFLGDTYNNTGYPSGITGNQGPDAISGIIQKIVDNGIELYLFVDGSMWNSTSNKFYTIVSNILPPENIFFAGTGGATVLNSLAKMEEMAVRTYDVRLAGSL